MPYLSLQWKVVSLEEGTRYTPVKPASPPTHTHTRTLNIPLLLV